MKQTQTRTWAEVSLSNLEHNYRALRAMLPQGCRFLGVVKADAYGHGAVQVARRLEKLGAEYLAVACLDEALELRQAGIKAPILILGYTPVERAGALLEQDITQTVYDLDTAKALSALAEQAGKPLKIHVKADTGMSRLGWLCDKEHLAETVDIICQVCALPGLEAEGIYTHFANADGDEDYTMLQFTRFLDLLDALKARNVTFAIRHCAASAAVLNYPCTYLDMVRPGIALYGHYPDPSCEGLDGPGLRPVMTLKTRVASVKTVPAGTPVSYGCTHVLERETRLAALTIGYADGLPRLCSDRWQVEINGQRAPIVGRVCMDMCMADVTGLDVAPGDEAEVFGEHLPVEALADLAGTIQYELLCAVSPRVHREYRD
ncbi:alanine racemase [Intestinimonas massiliensis (ex Afouda et al. 2020)]|uniref:alanine racemase n=1 Tax=Intestinimonas massiliensis (ex Afouda et al. 2020) TaxID=1673721 RepID=UPI001031BCE2|nr:alanine racemase [Intestinimonas massiliensis (ex Afouda et al. 2020)]